jgi:hypothetical protein
MIRAALLACILGFLLADAVAADALPYGSADDPRQLQDPNYRHAWQQLRRQEFQANYADVGRALKLSPAMVDRLLDLLVAQQLEMVETQPPMPVNAREMELYSRATQARLNAHQAAIAKLIGAGKIEAWHEYQESLAWRRSVAELRDRIGPGANALRDDQFDSLLVIMRQAHAEMMQPVERPADAPDPNTLSAADRRDYLHAMAHARIDARNERIHELAIPFLSPSQLAALDDWLASYQIHEGAARTFRATRAAPSEK